MSNTVLHVCDFEYASYARYQVWLSSAIGLKEINEHHVYSVRVQNGDIQRLIERKQFTLEMVRYNMDLISKWVGRNKEQLHEEDLVCCRSVYRQHSVVKDVLMSQIDRLCEWLAWQQSELLPGEISQSELPF